MNITRGPIGHVVVGVAPNRDSSAVARYFDAVRAFLEEWS